MELARPEPLQHVAYLHDGSLEGLLCCIFESYARREHPEDVVAESRYQPRLGQSALYVSTDYDRALRVRRGIEREGGARAFGAVVRASAHDSADTGVVVCDFVRLVMDGRRRRGKGRSVLDDEANPVVSRLLALERRVANEEEHLRQFVRFSELDNGVWFARCNPNAQVVPLVMPHFAARFNIQPFMIYDENHEIAGVYDGSDWHLVNGRAANVPERSADDRYVEALWQRFYDSLAIQARYNPELRRHFMPVRLWKNLPELAAKPARGLANR